MANSDSIFSSTSNEQRWVSQMKQTLSKEHIIVINDIPAACVFHVPKTVSDEKPGAYHPQQIGLGPYHHLRAGLYKHRQKLAAVERQLNPEQLSHFQSLFIDIFKQLEPHIRACYDKYLGADGDTLAWMVAIDGVFIFDLIASHFEKIRGTTTNDKDEGRDLEAIGDIMMLENQFPVFALKEILKRVNFKEPIDNDSQAHSTMYVMVRAFCEAQSPLKLNEQYQFQFTSRVHMLDYMYHLIVNNRGKRDPPPTPSEMKFHVVPCCALDENASVILDTLTGVGVGGEPTKAVTFIAQLPWHEILGLFKKQKESDDEKKSEVEEIEIPSASSLSNIAKVIFIPATGGIRDVKYEEEKRIFYLPVITLRKHTEIILRNLVAYEALIAKPRSCLELGEYVDLMCGIIDTAEDVKLLRGMEIIKGNDLEDEEIANIFNGISKSTGNPKNKSDLRKAVEKVNEHFDKMWKVKAYWFIKKNGYASWKFLTVLSTSVLLSLLVLQDFCQVYGCSRFSWTSRVA